jgi:uncharacterized protein
MILHRPHATILLMGMQFTARKVVRGQAQGLALVCPGSFSFLGDVDLETGAVIAAGHPRLGERLAGRVLVYNEAKGSSGGCVVLMSLFKAGCAPAAIITQKAADYNMAEGAILCGIPFLCEPQGEVLSAIANGAPLRVDADAGVIEVL